jgi:hypothetical protein
VVNAIDITNVEAFSGSSLALLVKIDETATEQKYVPSAEKPAAEASAMLAAAAPPSPTSSPCVFYESLGDDELEVAVEAPKPADFGTVTVVPPSLGRRAPAPQGLQERQLNSAGSNNAGSISAKPKRKMLKKKRDDEPEELSEYEKQRLANPDPTPDTSPSH